MLRSFRAAIQSHTHTVIQPTTDPHLNNLLEVFRHILPSPGGPAGGADDFSRFSALGLQAAVIGEFVPYLHTRDGVYNHILTRAN